mmetsp:Transcript_39816/g.99654  ORF Transcript_39816/g.99654 Transcript_39816/m.99654 type:complete len:215 (-) Transcript_39816:247-891(-)
MPYGGCPRRQKTGKAGAKNEGKDGGEEHEDGSNLGHLGGGSSGDDDEGSHHVLEEGAEARQRRARVGNGGLGGSEGLKAQSDHGSGGVAPNEAKEDAGEGLGAVGAGEGGGGEGEDNEGGDEEHREEARDEVRGGLEEGDDAIGGLIGEGEEGAGEEEHADEGGGDAAEADRLEEACHENVEDAKGEEGGCRLSELEALVPDSPDHRCRLGEGA